MVTTYRKRRGLFRFCKKPGMTVTLSDPFYPDTSLSTGKARRKLREQVYTFMKETSEQSENVIYIRYLPKEDEV